MRLYILLGLLLSCATNLNGIRTGMTEDQVRRSMGNPDSVKTKENGQLFLYHNRLVSGFSWDRADYAVELIDGKVANYGEINEQQNAYLNIQRQRSISEAIDKNSQYWQKQRELDLKQQEIQQKTTPNPLAITPPKTKIKCSKEAFSLDNATVCEEQ